MHLRRSIWLGLLGLGASALLAAWLGRSGQGAADVAAAPTARLIVRFAPEAASGRLATRAEAEATLRGISRSLGVTLEYGRPTANLAHLVGVRSAGRDLETLLRRLRSDPAVAMVEVDAVVRRALVPDDELFGDSREILWNLKTANAPRNGGANLPTAWDRTRGSGVTVAVLDTGIVTHGDLAANVLATGYDFVGADADGAFRVANDGDGRDADPTDPGDWITAGDLAFPVFSSGCTVAASSWHGTAMAGVVAAVGNNKLGSVGVAYESKVLPVRVLGKCKGYMSDIADAIRWASGALPAGGASWASLGIPVNTTPARVINLSLSGIGTCPTDSTAQSAIDAARAAGAVVVVATGNDGLSTIGSPSSCSGVIAVTSHTVEGDKMTTANKGPGTDLSAPGGGSCASLVGCSPHGTTGANGTIWRELWSTINTGTTGAVTDSQLVFGSAGTSVSAAHVSGAAALLLSAMPSLTPDGVESILKRSSRAFPVNTHCWLFEIGTLNCGQGLLDASAAMARLAALTPTVSAQTSTAVAAAGSTVTLTGTATAGSAGSAAALTYSWQQISGPMVTLSGAGTTSAGFTAPTPGGALSFRFTATDTTGAAASATVNVRANSAPSVNVIADRTARAGQTVTFSVGGTDPEADALSFTATGLPTGATLSSAGVFNYPAAVAGTYTVSVTASDGNLSSAPRSFVLTVTPNSAPTVNAIAAQTVRAGAGLTFTVTGTDPEGDALSFAATGLPAGATLSAGGVFNWASATPAGTYTISVTASDGLLTSAARSVTITVASNTAPTVNPIPNQSLREGQSSTFTATGSDAESDPLTFAATGLPAGATFSAAGVFDWPTAVAGTYSISVTVSDGLLTSTARIVTLTVRANTAPTVNAVATQTVRAGAAATFTVTGTDPEGDPLTFAATGLPAGATLSAGGVFNWASATPAGTYTISVTASDGLLTSAARSVTLTVTPNTAPSLAAIGDRSVRAGQSVSFTATGSDPEGDPLTFTATGLPAGATFSAAGVFIWPTAVAGTYTLSVTASDGLLSSATRTVTITVAPNTAPTVTAIADRTVRAGQALSFTATGSDAENDPLTFAATGLPAGATFSAAGVFSWPSPAPAGSYTISITASDGVFNSAPRAVTVTVTPNTAPTLGAVTNQTVRAGQSLTFSVGATDAENDAITLSMTGLPTGATATRADNAVVFSWPSPVAGSYTVTVSASDGLLTSTRQVGITVTPNTAPTVTAVAAQTVRNGATLTFTATGTDPENDALTFAATGLPAGATFSSAGVFSWVGATPVGNYTVSITASDGVFTSAPRTVSITVRTNTAPTVTQVGSFTVRLQSAVDLTITGTDPENDALTFSATGLPSGAVLSSAGVLTWSSASPGGDYPITVTASDGLLTSAPMTFTITVTNRTTDPGGGGGSMDLVGLGLLGLWGAARLRRLRRRR